MEPSAEIEYRVVQFGGGVEQLNKFTLRDRIRAGDVLPSTELALAGTDDWKPASSYPELARYFGLAAANPQAQVYASPFAPAPGKPVESMGHRVVQGVLYPIAGTEFVTLVVIAICSVVPIISILASLATLMYMLDIIRRSADGDTRMPAFIDTSDIGGVIWRALKVLFVMAVALVPFFLWIFYAAHLLLAGYVNLKLIFGGAVVTLGIAALYYPACLATVAVWDNALAAISPAYVAKVIRIIGSDYFIVIAMWFIASIVTGVARTPLLSPVAAIPVIGGVVGTFLSTWSLFYVSHLLGYAVYRHSRELGWD